MEFIYSEEFIDFVNSLGDRDRLKLYSTINKIVKFGIQESINAKWVKKLDSNLYEIRSHIGNNQQRGFYFHIENNEYYVTHGITKKSQKTPIKEIRRAKKIRTQYFDDNIDRK